MNSFKLFFLAGLFLVCSCAQSPEAKEKKNPPPVPSPPTPGPEKETVKYFFTQSEISDLEQIKPAEVEQNKNNCKEFVSKIDLLEKTQKEEVKKEIFYFASENNFGDWNKKLFDGDDSIFFRVDKAVIFNLISEKRNYKKNLVTCFIPKSVSVFSTKLNIEVNQKLKVVNNLQETNDLSSFSIMRGGIDWRPRQVYLNFRKFDNLMFHWFAYGLSSKIETLVFKTFEYNIPFVQKNIFDMVPNNGCRIRQLQISADNFKSESSYWIVKKRWHPEITSIDTFCSDTFAFFQTEKIETPISNPYKDKLPEVELLSPGANIHIYDNITGLRTDCGEFECSDYLILSIRKIFSKAFSPKNSKGSVWVRFVWKSEELGLSVLTTVEVAVGNGDILSVKSKFIESTDKVPEVQL